MLLDDRYRLEQVRAERGVSAERHVALWRATDTALGRRVALLLVTGRTKRSRREVADAATRASRVTDGRCVRVLDIGECEVGGDVLTWVAAEWVEGPSLAAVLRRSALKPPLAVEVVRQCAEALALAHRQGARHGRLHPDEVLLPPGGRRRRRPTGCTPAPSTPRCLATSMMSPRARSPAATPTWMRSPGPCADCRRKRWTPRTRRGNQGPVSQSAAGPGGSSRRCWWSSSRPQAGPSAATSAGCRRAPAHATRHCRPRRRRHPARLPGPGCGARRRRWP